MRAGNNEWMLTEFNVQSTWLSVMNGWHQWPGDRIMLAYWTRRWLLVAMERLDVFLAIPSPTPPYTYRNRKERKGGMNVQAKTARPSPC